MPSLRSARAAAFVLMTVASMACGQSEEALSGGESMVLEEGAAELVRIAVFNVEELSGEKIAETDADGIGAHTQARAAARIVQRVRPDILVLNEIDHSYEEVDQGLDLHVRRFASTYLATGEDPIDYPYVFVAPNNTGLLSGLDLDHSGAAAGPADIGDRSHGNDSFGFGLYPGQYSMAVLSQYPIDTQRTRTFQKFLWKDLPGNHVPPGYFSPEVLEVFRLSSKSHWDVPIRVGDNTLHLFVSHPTPPVFDGAEDRNGRRNFDEIKFWVEYLDDSSSGEALYDDAGGRGGFSSAAPFVILGDLNAYPGSPEGAYDDMPAISQLLDHPRIQDTGEVTTSHGALEAATAAREDVTPAGGGVGRPREPGPPHYPERATASWAGGVRVDYVLPSMNLAVHDGGAFWPSSAEDADGSELAARASDHHLVWIDVSFRDK